jgi:pimeloyl-ACP methyl ester carboxylesterase
VEYFNSIKTDKQLYILENSAHFPQWEEAEKYNQIMIDLNSKTSEDES